MLDACFAIVLAHLVVHRRRRGAAREWSGELSARRGHTAARLPAAGLRAACLRAPARAALRAYASASLDPSGASSWPLAPRTELSMCERCGLRVSLRPLRVGRMWGLHLRCRLQVERGVLSHTTRLRVPRARIRADAASRDTSSDACDASCDAVDSSPSAASACSAASAASGSASGRDRSFCAGSPALRDSHQRVPRAGGRETGRSSAGARGLRRRRSGGGRSERQGPRNDGALR